MTKLFEEGLGCVGTVRFPMISWSGRYEARRWAGKMLEPYVEPHEMSGKGRQHKVRPNTSSPKSHQRQLN